MNLIEQYKKLHKDKPKYGHSGSRNIPMIEHYADLHKCWTILDFGCGKGNIVKKLNAKGYACDGYDPGVPEFSDLPNNQYDMVVSTDVFEHIPEADVPRELELAIDRAKKVAILVIALRYDKTNILPDGSNPHKTVKASAWWVGQIKKACHECVVTVKNLKEGYEGTFIIEKHYE